MQDLAQSHPIVPSGGLLVYFDPAGRPTRLFFNRADVAFFRVCRGPWSRGSPSAPSPGSSSASGQEPWQLAWGEVHLACRAGNTRGSEQKRRNLLKGVPPGSCGGTAVEAGGQEQQQVCRQTGSTLPGGSSCHHEAPGLALPQVETASL